MSKTFLIQTINNKLPFDFSFYLTNEINKDIYLDSDNNKFLKTGLALDFDYSFFEGFDFQSLNDTDIYNTVPIGSVEFIIKFLKDIYNIDYKPINIPDELLKDSYMNRKWGWFNSDQFFGDYIPDDEFNSFAKDWDRLKGVVSTIGEIIYDDKYYHHDKEYFWSSTIDILSEWRVFVHRGQIIDCRSYSGDWFEYPDHSIILDMVKNYKDSPISYTLDVAVTSDNKTVIIEVHDFFSCGLYGFEHNKIPYMFSQWFFEYIRKNKNLNK